MAWRRTNVMGAGWLSRGLTPRGPDGLAQDQRSGGGSRSAPCGKTKARYRQMDAHRTSPRKCLGEKSDWAAFLFLFLPHVRTTHHGTAFHFLKPCSANRSPQRLLVKNILAPQFVASHLTKLSIPTHSKSTFLMQSTYHTHLR